MLAEAMRQIISGEEDNVLVPCSCKENQESVRVMLFHLRNKLKGPLADTIAISKFSYADHLYVKVYKKTSIQLFKLDSEGRLIKITNKMDAETERMIKLMRADGKTEEEIKEQIGEEKEDERTHI